MRVLIDCTQITKMKAGVGIYAENMIREMIELKPDSQFFLLIQDDDPDLNFTGRGNVKLIRVNARLFRKLPLRFLLEQLFIPFLALRHGIEVVHSLHYSFPLLPMAAKKVVTIHDMTMFLMPEVHLSFKVRYFQFFIRAASRSTQELIFDSHSSREDFLTFFPRPTPRCNVVHLGKSAAFRPDLDPAQVESVVKAYGLKKPFILYVGMIEPRKNLNRLIEAFSTIITLNASHTLVIAGKKGWMYESLFELVKTRSLSDRVLFIGFVAERDKPYLIRGAHIFAYPSLYEGFGIPVLEAMACGTPTLTSNVSSMPEIAGKAAYLVDPTSASEIALGLQALIDDGPLRQALTDGSVAQVAQFSWSRTATETLSIYRIAAQKN